MRADGTPLSVTDGIAATIGANGDAYYGNVSGLIRPSEKPGFMLLEGTGVIFGGKGRFAGASGHFVLRSETEQATGKGGYTFEGMITPPKAP